MIPNFWLYPIKPVENRKQPPWIAFDCENDPVTGKFISVACAGEYLDSNGYIHKLKRNYFEDRFEFMEYLRWIASHRPNKNAFRLVGFNVDYDLAFITEIVNDESRLSAGSRLITAHLKMGSKKGIKIYDCSNFVRGSLGQWINDLKMPGIVKLPLSELVERNKMDAKATLYLIEWIEEFMKSKLGIPLQLTIGASSLYYFKLKFLNQGLMRHSKFLNKYERNAYKGGRTEVFKRGLRYVESFDVHKMYLSIMRDEMVPKPQSARYIKGNIGFEKIFNSDTQFIAQVTVKIPKQKIPPLPYYSEKIHKLIFPTGVITGYFTSVELRDAVKNYGVIIEKVIDYVYYNESLKLFHDFADNVVKLIKEYEESNNPNLRYMIKTVGNSLYGKLGEKHGGGQWIKLCDLTGPAEGLMMSMLGQDEYVYQPGGEATDSNHTFPCIPAFITSYARVKLLRKMKTYEDNVVYCDTDSVHYEITRGMILEDETWIGGFGFEYARGQIYWRPKLYADKRKGIPKSGELIGKTEDGEFWIYTRPYKRAEALRRHKTINLWEETLKIVKLEDNKRVWNGDESEAIEMI